MKHLVSLAALCLVSMVACSSKNSTPPAGGTSGTAAAGCDTQLDKAEYCSTCTVAANATP